MPFYQDPAMIEQSVFDRNATTYELWQSNLDEKQKILENRIDDVMEQINLEP